MTACYNECGPGDYLVSFYLFDRLTGKPYFDVHKGNLDSLKLLLTDGSTYRGTVVDRDEIGDRILPYALSPDANDTLYFYFNRFDMDTLILTKQITRVYGKCDDKDFITTIFYNGNQQRELPRDSIWHIKLFK